MEAAARCSHGEKSRAGTQRSGKDETRLWSGGKWPGGQDLHAIKADIHAVARTETRVQTEHPSVRHPLRFPLGQNLTRLGICRGLQREGEE